MTNNTLKSTIEAIIASNALVVVTLDGTFNSLTGAPILNARTRPDQRNAFLKQYTERVNPAEAKTAEGELSNRISALTERAKSALDNGHFAAAINFIEDAQKAQEQIDQPRMYYRIKPNVDLRTVAEKRTAKKAENAARKATKQAEKEAAAAAKMADKVEPAQSQTTQIDAPKTGKAGKKAA